MSVRNRPELWKDFVGGRAGLSATWWLSISRARPRVPWYAKAVAVAVAAYALSHLIPDFIPVLGQVDDLLILPLGILLSVTLIPPEILAEHRAAALDAEGRPASRAAAAVIIAI